MFVNARGLISKIDNLKDDVGNMNLDIIGGVGYRSQAASEQEINELLKRLILHQRNKN